MLFDEAYPDVYDGETICLAMKYFITRTKTVRPCIGCGEPTEWRSKHTKHAVCGVPCFKEDYSYYITTASDGSIWST